MNIKYIVIVVAVIALGTAVFASTRNTPASVPTASVDVPTATSTPMVVATRTPIPQPMANQFPNMIYSGTMPFFIARDGLWEESSTSK